MEVANKFFWSVGAMGNLWMMSIGFGVATQQDWVDAYRLLDRLLSFSIVLLERLSLELLRFLV